MKTIKLGGTEYVYNDLSELSSVMEDLEIIIGNGVSIGDNVSIDQYVFIGDGCTIENHVSISRGSTIWSRCLIKEQATIGTSCDIEQYSTVESNVFIPNGISIPFNSNVSKVTQIIGSRHRITYWGGDEIKIGCKVHKIDYWKENFRRIGRLQEYSLEEVEEYGKYIEEISNM